LFSNRGPAARRRRRRKEENDDAGQQAWLPRNIGNLTQKRRNASGIYQPRTLRKDHLVDNIPHAKVLARRNCPSDLRISLSNSGTTMTDLEESRILSTVSVKRINRASIAKMNNIKKPGETKNVDLQSEKHRDSNGNSSVTQHSVVTVVRVKRVPHMEETDKYNSNTSQQDTLSATSTIPKKTTQVNVTKVPRSKTPKTQRPRATSVGNVSIIQLEPLPIRMRSLTNQSQMSTLATEGKTKKGNGIVVTKIPRKIAALHSHPP
jgi:hypothetical protein